MGEQEEDRLPWGLISVITVIALVAILVLSWRLRPTDEQPGTLIVGDSVTYLSGGSIDTRFDKDHTQFVAKPGYPSSELLPLVIEAMDETGTPAADRKIFAALVGYNDVRVRNVDPASLPALVKAASQFECAVFLTLPARPGGQDNPNWMVPSDLVDQWNLHLADAVADYPNVHLAHDWEDVVERAPREVMLTPDMLHPTNAGKRRLADAYRSAVDRHCGDVEPAEVRQS